MAGILVTIACSVVILGSHVFFVLEHREILDNLEKLNKKVHDLSKKIK